MKRPVYSTHCGAALMLSLWALFLLGALIINWALDIDSRIVLNGDANRTLEAEAAACSGAAIALDPDAESGDAVPNGPLVQPQTYHARITGHGTRDNPT